MKKIVISIMVFVAIIALNGLAEGFFPSTDEMFGVAMPSISFAIGREPNDTNMDDNGTTEVYEGFTIDEYDTFGIYVAGEGCTCEKKSVENGILTLGIQKDGAEVLFQYDLENSVASIFYPENTRIEKNASTVTKKDDSAFPAIGDVFGTELPSLDAVLAKKAGSESASSDLVYDRAYKKLHNLYPEGLPDIITSNLPVIEPDLDSLDDGNKHQNYEGVQEESYDALSRFLQLCGCSLEDYSKNAEVFTATIEKDNSQFQIVFDNKAHTVDVTYPRMSHVVQMDFHDDPTIKGIFPDVSVAFGVFVPRPSVAIGKDADETVTLEDGALEEKYNHFTEEDYNAYSTYIQKEGCSLVDYFVNGDVMTILLEKGGAQFEFAYDKANEKATVTYLAGTRPEITPSPSPTPKPTPTPAPKTKPASNWQYVMYNAELQIMKTYNCKEPTVLSVYTLTDEEYALMYFEFSFYANGSYQETSLVYKGTKLPGQDDNYELLGNSPNVYGHTLSDYTHLR